MPLYYVNPNRDDSGNHEVHKQDCSWLALIKNPVYLGIFSTCHEAVAEAIRRLFIPADGCWWCSRVCHTR